MTPKGHTLMSAFMSYPDQPTIATTLHDVPLYKPNPEKVDPFTLMLLQVGLLPMTEAVESGMIDTITIPAGTTGVVIEQCSEDCGHFAETGQPCNVVVRWDNGPIAGEESVLAAEEVSLYVPAWSDVDDAFLYSESHDPEDWDDAFSAEFPSDDPDDDPRYW